MSFIENQHFTPPQIKTLRKAGIEELEDFLYRFPNRYRFFSLTNIQDIKPNEEIDVYFAGIIISVSKTEKYISAKVNVNGININIMWFGNPWIYNKINNWQQQIVYVCGKVQRSPIYGYSCTQPVYFTKFPEEIKIIYPVYSALKGINELNYIEKMANYIHYQKSYNDELPIEIRQQYNLISKYEAICKIHFPYSQADLVAAQSYFMIEKLYNYAKGMKELEKYQRADSNVIVNDNVLMESVKEQLPFKLTNAQADTITNILLEIKKGKRVQAMVQGDVSCGKTITAQLTMIAVAENGYQVALIAPTTVLAEQHYIKMVDLVKDSDLSCIFLKGEMTEKQKKKAYEEIAQGKHQVIIGTTAVLSDKVIFKNLGLVVTDEEQRFGVEQKQKLAEKGMDGIHIISMSATPIPRSLAQAVYTDQISVYNINELPPGRIPVKTFQVDRTEAFRKLIEEAGKGYKTYIICPKIEESEKETISVDEAFDMYQTNCPGINFDFVTGKLKQSQIQEKIKEFRDTTTDAIVSTTVVEVGVDVPNATLIIIEDADMFGLSQLHQLRGRVGRAGIESFCYLIPSANISEKGKERLKTLCETNDGFVISQKDLEMRGPGELLGTKQSGEDDGLNLALKYPNTYMQLKQMV